MELKDDPIYKILTRFKKITIVGLSPDPKKPSHEVARYLMDADYEISAVRPATEEILGSPCYESLSEIPDTLEIVDVFRASENIPALVDELIQVGAKVLWLQEGVTHPEAEKKARASGIFVISNRCIKKEHQRISKDKALQAS